MILVNAVARRAKTPFGPRAWAHMVSTTSLSELHEFAARLGVPRAAFRADHYPLLAAQHAHAVRLGAELVASWIMTLKMVGARGPLLEDLRDEDAPILRDLARMRQRCAR